MFAVIGRFNRSYEEAARDLGATAWQGTREVTLPILLPGIIGVALFGFTLSYDEFARTVLTAGSQNTLPLEIWAMTTNVTSPALYAVGTVTTLVSFTVIGTALGSIALIQRHRSRHATSSDMGLPATPALPSDNGRKSRHGPSCSKRQDRARRRNQAIYPGCAAGGGGPRPACRARRLLLSAWAERLRQDDDPADDRGA